jgi:hypothetical protein
MFGLLIKEQKEVFERNNNRFFSVIATLNVLFYTHTHYDTVFPLSNPINAFLRADSICKIKTTTG